jgi:plastocyanin
MTRRSGLLSTTVVFLVLSTVLVSAAAPVASALPALPGGPPGRQGGEAHQTWEVQAGGDVPAEGIQTHAYYPRALTVRAGDTVQWRFAGIASVTFDAFRPLREHFLPGPEPGDLTLGPGWFPQGPAGPAAAFDGTVVASSGVAQPPADAAPPYRLTFTRPGLYPYVDVIHPGTSGVVQVLPAGAALPETPAQAAARGQRELAGVLAALRDLVAGTAPVRQPGPGGTAVHVVAAAVSTGLGAGANRYLPADLTVRRGDTVVWTNGDDFAPHTVTFTSGEAVPPFLEPRPQPGGSPLVVAPARSVAPSGGTVYTGSGFLNSGLIGSGNAFAVTFAAPPGRYAYACVLHVGQNHTGTVTVTE